MKINNSYDLACLYLDQITNVFDSIYNKKEITYSVIPKLQYHKALSEFMRYAMFVRFPEDVINNWCNVIYNNVCLLNALTDIQGHSSYFPMEEFLDTFDYEKEYTLWRKNNDHGSDFYNAYEYMVIHFDVDNLLPLHSNGQWLLSDYAINPLSQLCEDLISCESATDKLVIINKILDITHQRGDLAELFIEGGSASLELISNC